MPNEERLNHHEWGAHADKAIWDWVDRHMPAETPYYVEADSGLRIDVSASGVLKAQAWTETGLVLWTKGNGRTEYSIPLNSQMSSTDLQRLVSAIGSAAMPGHTLVDTGPAALSLRADWGLSQLSEFAARDSRPGIHFIVEGRVKSVRSRSRNGDVSAYSTDHTRITAASSSDNKWHSDSAHASEAMVAIDLLDRVEVGGLAELAERSATLRGTLDGLPAARPGQYRCVFLPAAASVIVHEVIGHVLEEDNYRDLAAAGHLIASEPLLPNADLAISRVADSQDLWVPAPADGLGVVAAYEPLVQNGHVESLLSTEEAAGNSRRASWRDPVVTRMGALRVDGVGDSWLDARSLEGSPTMIVSEAGNGLLNVRTGLCMIEIARATVRDGDRSYEVSGNYLRAPLREVLNAIEGTTRNDMATHRSYCIKNGQKVPVSIVTGSLVLRSIAIA